MHSIPPDLGKPSLNNLSHLPMHCPPLPFCATFMTPFLIFLLFCLILLFGSLFLYFHSTWKEYFLNTTVISEYRPVSVDAKMNTAIRDMA